MSFVNGVFTNRGGKHLTYLTDHIVAQLQPAVERRLKRSVKPSLIRQHLCVFCNCLIENPTFDSQTKECLTTNSKVGNAACNQTIGFWLATRTFSLVPFENRAIWYCGFGFYEYAFKGYPNP